MSSRFPVTNGTTISKDHAYTSFFETSSTSDQPSLLGSGRTRSTALSSFLDSDYPATSRNKNRHFVQSNQIALYAGENNFAVGAATSKSSRHNTSFRGMGKRPLYPGQLGTGRGHRKQIYANPRRDYKNPRLRNWRASHGNNIWQAWYELKHTYGFVIFKRNL